MYMIWLPLTTWIYLTRFKTFRIRDHGAAGMATVYSGVCVVAMLVYSFDTPPWRPTYTITDKSKSSL